METATALAPPGGGTGKRIGCADDWPDYIRELGDRIASLTIKETAELSDYLEGKI